MDNKILLDSPNVPFIFSLDNVTDNATLQNNNKKKYSKKIFGILNSVILSPWDFLMTLDITV